MDALPVPDTVWVATALLHRERPDALGFEVEEIVARARKEGVEADRARHVETQATVFCVANMRPTSVDHRYLYATTDGRRRLFRSGDDFHPDRMEGATLPRDLPDAYQELLTWYEEAYDDARAPVGEAGEVEAGAQAPRMTYRVLRAGEPQEAETLLQRFAEEGWVLAEAVPVPEDEAGSRVWLVLERPR